MPLSQRIIEDFTESQYIDFFNNKNNIEYKLGGVIGDINLYHKKPFPRILQSDFHKGAGVFSFLKGLAKSSLPFIQRLILPEAVNFTSNLINSKLQNKKIDKENLKNLAKQSLKNIASKALSGGRKRKKYTKKSKVKRQKIKKKNIIFKKYLKKKKSKKKKTNIKKNKNKFKIFHDI